MGMGIRRVHGHGGPLLESFVASIANISTAQVQS